MSDINPLLADFETPPFSKIENKHFKPAIKKALEQAQAEIDAITENEDRPNFENTIAALDASGEKLGRVASIFFNLNSAETNPEMQKIAQEVSPWLTKFQNDLILNEKLFERVKTVYDNRADLDLNTEQQTLLDTKIVRAACRERQYI